jgi:hypothetical protein
LQADSPETLGLLARVRQGDDQALGELIARHRPALRRFVELAARRSAEPPAGSLCWS